MVLTKPTSEVSPWGAISNCPLTMHARQFLVMASADPSSAPLQRLQVIKGWVDAEGETHEEVIDVACAGGAAVDPRLIVALTTVLGRYHYLRN